MKSRYVTPIIFISVVILLLIIDLVTKALTKGDSYNIIPNVLSFESVKNTGIAFSWFSGGGTWLIMITSALSVAAIVAWWVYGRNNIFATLSFALFIAGAIGNLYDRIFYGYVRDFIMLEFIPNFAIFNFADICLTVGTIMLMVYYLVVSWNKK